MFVLHLKPRPSPQRPRPPQPGQPVALNISEPGAPLSFSQLLFTILASSHHVVLPPPAS